MIVQVVGQVLRHALGQGGDQHPLAPAHHGVDFAEQVFHLGRGWAHDDLRVDQPGGPHHLLHHLASKLRFVRARGGGDEQGLRAHALPLVEAQRPVVERRRQAEAVFHQGFLAGAVALVHAADLRNRDVGFVDHQQGVLGQVVEQRRRRLARLPAGQVAGVVLDPRAVAELGDHLQVEAGALLQTLRLHELVVLSQVRQALAQLVLDVIKDAQNAFPRRHVVGLGKHREARHPVDDLAGEGIECREVLDFIVEQLHPHRQRLRLRREDVHHVAPHPVGAALKGHVVARVLQFRQPREDVALVHPIAPVEVQHHAQVGLRVAQAVDGRDGSDDQGVAPLKERLGGRQPHLLDVGVDRGVLLDVGVRGGHIGFRLVVVVVGDEVLHRVVGKELAELPVKLGGQGFVRRQHQRRPIHRGHHVGDSEGLAGAGDAEQRLVA